MASRISSLLKNILEHYGNSLPRPTRIAVLIDADGVSPKDAERVLERVRSLGRICILRTYGNFSGRTASVWAKLMRTHGAVARHMPSVAPKKNAADIALSIDAIEIMLTRHIDVFVIIASDSDFAPLARRISEQGKDILGFGHKSTPVSFRNVCTSFIEMHTLNRKRPAAPLWSLTPADAVEILLPALQTLCVDGRPVELATLGHHLAETIPGFDCRTYGKKSLSDLVRELPSTELLDLDGKRLVRPAAAEFRTG